jgi:predicted transcriptional regulator
MKTLSLKLDDLVYQETEQVLDKIKKPRNRYINEALAYYNRIQKKKIIAKVLEKESKLVSDESLKVLAEFENLEEYDS